MSYDYEYDIFISYRHKGPAFSWVTQYLYPELDKWLPEHVDFTYKPKIFLDKSIETGSEWPATLRHALKTSRFIIPILSPAYFQSEWCCKEFYTMRKRENLLSLRTEHNTKGLIYPIIFASPTLLPTDVREHIQYKDMRPWATNQSNFRESKHFEAFENEIKLICQDLWKMIQQAPKWAEWPLAMPEDIPPNLFDSSWKPGWS